MAAMAMAYTFVKLNPSAEDFARFNCGGIWERARRFPA
jgi:hypothetical protein